MLIVGALLVSVILVVVHIAGGAPSRAGSSGERGGSGRRSVYRAAVPSITASLRSAIRFPGRAVKVPFPAQGQGAVGVAGVGMVGQSANERPVPIASVTKVMTAVIVLRDHPLLGSAGGPVLTMTAADHEAWILASEADNSNVEVVAGERIDERQMLEALLIPSADNMADILARWDAGSLPAFVAKMNAEAQRLGLRDTHYADASGLAPASRSTAHDQVVLGGYAMANPVIASIVQNAYVDLPTSGRVWNYNPAIGVDGIVGLKSGFTQQAAGCLVTAAWRTAGGRKVLVISAAFGLVLGLYEAATADESMLDAVSSELAARTILPAGAAIGRAMAAWDHRSATVTLDPAAGSIVVVGWPGLVIDPSLRPLAPPRGRQAQGWPAGSRVATLEVSSAGERIASVPAILSGALPSPPPGWAPSHT